MSRRARAAIFFALALLAAAAAAAVVAGYGSSVAVTATFGMVAAARALDLAAVPAGRPGAPATL